MTKKNECSQPTALTGARADDEKKIIRNWVFIPPEYEMRILIILAAFAALCASYGFWKTLHYSWSNDSGLMLRQMGNIILHIAQLFVLKSSFGTNDMHEIPSLLVVASLLAPLTLGIAACKVFATILKLQFWLPLFRKHVIICGLGERGLELVRGYRRLNRNVVAIEKNAGNDFIPTCRALGALVVVGDAVEEVVLRKAYVRHAGVVFAISGDDGSNFEIGTRVAEVIGKMPRKRRNKVNCYIAVKDIMLTDIGPSSRLFTDSPKNSTTRIVRINDLAARMLFRDYHLDRETIRPESRTEVHLIVIGFGSMGESLVLQAARIGHFANGKKIRISVIDHEAQRKGKMLLQVLPGLSECCAVEFIDMNIQSPEFGEFVTRQINVPEVLPFTSFCLNDTMASVSMALRIKKMIGRAAMPIHIRLNDDSGLGVLLARSGVKSPQEWDIHGFGLIDRTCTPDILECWTLDRMARAIHEDYVMKRKAEGADPRDPSLLPWDELESSLRDSNRQQADHIPVKLRVFGYQAVDECNEGPSAENERITEFPPEELQTLARMEHKRWNAERFLSGWKLGAQKDVENRISPWLVDWEQLPKKIQTYDIQAVQNIPAILQLQGKWICRGR